MSAEAGSSTYRSPSRNLLEAGTLIKQGAEARVYAVSTHLAPPSTYWPPSLPASSSTPPTPSIPSPPLILKHRFPKTYRHPTLDAALTKSRLSFEARALGRCLKAGVVVPRVMWVDEKEGVLGMEMIQGWSVREILGGGAEGEVEVEPEEAEEEVEEGMERLDMGGEGGVEESEGWIALRNAGVSQEHLMTSVGSALARLHSTGIIHGDLTTSNMMIRLTPSRAEAYEVVLIDFGLSSQAQYAENYAVDLYVLERAFGSTHPASEGLFAGVLGAYGRGMGKKWADIEKRLKEVRLRGRKRDMTG